MHIPKYWAKETQELDGVNGGPFLAQCWRWSDISKDEARRRAQVAIKEIARTIRNNEKPDRYSYGERPLREEIIKSFANGKNEQVAVITRNGYCDLWLHDLQAHRRD